MNDNTTIREMVRTLAGFDDLLYESAICTVSDVNTTANTCTCTPIDGSAEFGGVQLSMNKSKGFLLIPTDGSLVTVTQINDFDAFISMVSDVDTIYLNGETEGGLVKVKDLVTKLNNLEKRVNGMQTTFNTHTHVASGFGIPTTVPSALQTPQLTETTAADLENDNIKQG